MQNFKIIIEKVLIIALITFAVSVALTLETTNTESSNGWVSLIIVTVFLTFITMAGGWRLMMTNAKFRRKLKREALDEYLSAKLEIPREVWDARYGSKFDLERIMKDLINKP